MKNTEDFEVYLSASHLVNTLLTQAVDDCDGEISPAVERVLWLLQCEAFNKELGDISIEFNRAYNKFQAAVTKDNIARLFK